MNPAALQIYLLVHGAPEAQGDAGEALIEMAPATRALAEEVQRLSGALSHRLGHLPRDVTRWCSEIASSDPHVRGRAARSLLSDPSPEVRKAAVRALGALADPGTASVLAGSLEDSDPAIRALAIDALGARGAVASQFLIDTLRDSEYPHLSPRGGHGSSED